MARENEHESEHQIGDGRAVRVGCVRHHDPKLSGRRHVDRIVPHSVTGDHLQPRQSSSKSARSDPVNTRDDAVHVSDTRRELMILETTAGGCEHHLNPGALQSAN
jgi:hypothetical protein